MPQKNPPPTPFSERAFLVGLRSPNQSRPESQESLDELKSLVETAGVRVTGLATQELKKIDPAFFMGKGKAHEISETLKEKPCDVVVIDEDLSPTQHRNLQELWKVKVMDRTGVILDIFAQHARTKEGKLQVELAQYLYLLPRLVGQWSHFSRQTGGIGTRGPGETQLEVDRRRAREKIEKLKKDLERVQASRELHRLKRLDVPIPTVSLIGYTNAGKSTLMNAFTDAGVLVEDKLFATLDPTVRRLKLPSGREVLLTDTVGFIRKLPHALVESFKATFEEIEGSDLLIHVIDLSHPSREEHIRQVRQVLKEIRLDEKPIVEVYNKADCLGPHFPKDPKKIYLSALKKEGLAKLLEVLDRKLTKGFKKVTLEIPYQEGMLVHFLHRHARILRKDYEDWGMRFEVEIHEKYLSDLKKYRAKK